MGGYGWGLKKTTVDRGPVEQITLQLDDYASPNSNSTQDIQGVAHGMLVHQTFSTFTQFFVTTAAASANASVTLTNGPFFKVIIYNPHATATVYVNLNAAAVIPVAATTAGSFPLGPGSYYTEEFVVNTVQVRSATASIDVWIGAFQ